MRKSSILVLAALLFPLGASEANASTVTLEGGPGLSASLQCAGKKLRFLSSIPGLTTQDAAEGRAVAVILEAPDTRPEILVGRSERSASGLRVAAEIEGSALPVTALAQDKPLTITRLGESFVIPPQRRSGAVVSTIRECGKELNVGTSATSARAVEGPADLSLEGDRRWIVLASRVTPTEAIDVLNDLRPRFPDAQVLKSANGRFAVVAGPVRVSDSASMKARLVREKGAPADMFFTQGENMVARVQAQSSTPRCRVQDTPDKSLNVRLEPSGKVVGILNEGQKLLVSDRQTDQRGQVWLHARAQDGLAGWVFAKYVSCDQAAR